MKFDKHFENQRLKYEKFDKSLFVNTVDSYKLAFLYISYVHYENNEDDFDNVLNSIVYNRSKSYIDAILVDNNSEDSGMNVYNFTYYEPNRSLDFDEVKKAITSIDKILSQMERGIFEYQTTELINQFRTVESEIDKNSRVIIRIVTNIDANKKAKKDNNKILNEYFKSFPIKHEWEILYSDDILDYIDEVDNPNQAASVGEISIDDDDNTIQYKSERVDAYLVNISAKSLKTLYENNGNKLFGLNLRYYVKNDKVDLGITETISKNKNNFWYMNNGIIIIADKAEFNNNKIRLENFSIINGGQTTKMIGESTFDEDFFLVCKLIVSGRLTEDEKISFISTVADATNSQKQILPKDPCCVAAHYCTSCI
jgi:predicted transcriptional regulator with HTH domain